ncbi:hypothetical protein BN903_11 [Halorubrum sp. AJ67]|nr:hypothetical protein BN903_11 [Halorubrum sp. AJ67]
MVEATVATLKAVSSGGRVGSDGGFTPGRTAALLRIGRRSHARSITSRSPGSTP